MSSAEAAMMEGEFMGENDIDQEEMFAMMGEKVENIQQLLKESLVDTDFYNGMFQQQFKDLQLFRIW
jgi:hypothetical protein